MLLQLLINLSPGLIAISCGILTGTLFRRLSKYSPLWEELSERQARGLLLVCSRNACVILVIVFTILVFTKYTFSFSAFITITYLAFLISSILWGIFMGLIKSYVDYKWAIKFFQKL
jgi:hypothetical protein